MLTISGIVERITYYNVENGYAVIRLRPERPKSKGVVGLNLEGLITIVGNLPKVSPGEKLTLEGEYVTHPRHGIQFKASNCEKVLPVTTAGIERYLGSGLIRGIGPTLAKRIVDHFKSKTLEIIEDNPDQLLNVPGIGIDRTETIIKAWTEQKQVKEIMLFLHSHKISTNLALKIYKMYGDQALTVVKHNPYQLEQDINGIGFITADRIAQQLGLPADHPSRIEAGVIYLLNSMVGEGHVYSPEKLLINKAMDLLALDKRMIDSALSRLISANRIHQEKMGEIHQNSNLQQVADPIDSCEESLIYLTPFIHCEKETAACISALLSQTIKPKQEKMFVESETLSQDQIKALKMAIQHFMSIITGGPGTGKTTCLKALIRYLETQHTSFALASPTGRAAKRLSEATGRPASTIHRLLSYTPMNGFQRNAKHPLNVDFLIIDEASMLDLMLAYHLLSAVKPGTRVLFVGDVDQLPSVGAGDVLRDILTSGEVPVYRLSTIYRQSEKSQIVMNAHFMNKGQMPVFSKTTQGDFFLFPANESEKAADWIVDLVTKRIPEQFSINPMKEIQVLSPMYRGAAGVDILNEKLQETLNPPVDEKPEIKLFGRLFRLGDKVMQIKNNYDKDIYNGDIGYISDIDTIEQTLSVVVDSDRQVIYDFSEADELVLAYTISVHKSQGSEFPAVVMPVLTQHYIMLQRNLLYTCITRAERLCVLVGNKKALQIAINNNKVSHRHSRLAYRIKKAYHSFDKENE